MVLGEHLRSTTRACLLVGAAGACEAVSFWSGDGGPPLGAAPVAQGLVLAALCATLPQSSLGGVVGWWCAAIWVLVGAAFDLWMLTDVSLLFWPIWLGLLPLWQLVGLAGDPYVLPVVLTHAAGFVVGAVLTREGDPLTRGALLVASIPLAVRAHEFLICSHETS